MRAYTDLKTEMEQQEVVNVLEYKPGTFSSKISYLPRTLEAYDMAKPDIFSFPDYQSAMNVKINRYGALKKAEELPEEPWKIPTESVIGMKYYTALVRH